MKRLVRFPDVVKMEEFPMLLVVPEKKRNTSSSHAFYFPPVLDDRFFSFCQFLAKDLRSYWFPALGYALSPST